MPETVTARPLYVGAHAPLLDEVLRLAAAAGVELDVVPDPGAARRQWLAAPLVLVGGDVAEQAAAVGLPRREDVLLVTADLDDAQVWQRAVHVGARRIAFLPEAEAWLVDELADVVAGGRARCVAVVGGRGGAGATTLAVALAVTGTRTGRSTLLVDGDPLGGGIDLALGGESTTGVRWPELVTASGRVSPLALREALPAIDALSVLSWDRSDVLDVPADAMSAVLNAGLRGGDLVVVDLPRRVGDAASVALAAADLTLLVVPAEVRAVAAAARVAAAVSAACADLRVVVRDPAPSGLSAEVVAELSGCRSPVTCARSRGWTGPSSPGSRPVGAGAARSRRSATACWPSCCSRVEPRDRRRTLAGRPGTAAARPGGRGADHRPPRPPGARGGRAAQRRRGARRAARAPGGDDRHRVAGAAAG